MANSAWEEGVRKLGKHLYVLTCPLYVTTPVLLPVVAISSLISEFRG